MLLKTATARASSVGCLSPKPSVVAPHRKVMEALAPAHVRAELLGAGGAPEPTAASQDPATDPGPGEGRETAGPRDAQQQSDGPAGGLAAGVRRPAGEPPEAAAPAGAPAGSVDRGSCGGAAGRGEHVAGGDDAGSPGARPPGGRPPAAAPSSAAAAREAATSKRQQKLE